MSGKYNSTKKNQQRERQRRMRRKKNVRRVFILIAIMLVVIYFAGPVIERRFDAGYGKNLMDDSDESIMADNPELEAFMRKYESGNYKTGRDIEYTSKEKRADFPMLFQWDKRWGYESYGSSVIGITGCAPTAMTMVIVGLNDDESVNPRVLADYAMEKGLYEDGAGTSWRFFPECAESYVIECREISLSEAVILDEVNAGHPIVCGMRPGHFTAEGHFIVIVGAKDGGFVVHDPNSVSNSETIWEYDTIADEIKVLWAFSK